MENKKSFAGEIALAIILLYFIVKVLTFANQREWGSYALPPEPATKTFSKDINWEAEKVKAKSAKKAREYSDKKFAEYEKFCGKGNVWTGSTGHWYESYSVYGCDDYTKVDDKKLK